MTQELSLLSAQGRESQTLLELKGLRGGYGRINVLEGIDLKVQAREIMGVFGHNGMGKTTLMRAVMGEVRVSAGQIRWQGQLLQRLTTHQRARQGLGYVPQGRRIFPQLTVLENLQFAAACRRGASIDQVVGDILSEFPALTRLLDRTGGALSGGEQQILALARCLCTDPELVLLDEPTEGIQPSIIDEMVGVLQGLRNRRGLTIVLVEQHLEFLRALCDRIVLLEKGRIIREARPDEQGAVDELINAAGFTY